MGKYIQVFKNYEGSYLPGCPVIIVGKALVKEEYTGDIYAQVKFQNIGSKSIVGISASVTVFDVYGKELNSVKDIQYLNLNVERGSEFGSKTLIPLDTNARSFDLGLDQVRFADGSALQLHHNSWEKLPEQELLIDKLGKELAEEYYRQTSQSSRYVPCKNKSIWLCSCGAVNLADEESCRDCGQKYSELVTALDEDKLAASIKQRLEEEARLNAERAEKEAKSRRKRTKTICISLAIIFAICLSAYMVKNVLVPGNAYKSAMALYDAKDYYNAYAGFDALKNYRDSQDMACECKYLYGQKLCSEEKLDEACGVFRSLGNYKNSNELAEKLEIIISLSQCSKGDIVTLGEYEQDNNSSNGSEPIRWRVLKATNDSTMLISQQALDMRPFNDSRKAVTWETSSLRTWLNDDFYNAAFNEGEKMFIKETALENAEDEDKVFLLSSNEAMSLFSGDDSRKTSNTEYAVRNTDPYYKKFCFWWLRSRSSDRSTEIADIVDGSGGMIDVGFMEPAASFVDEYHSVRPVIWVNNTVNLEFLE